MNMHENQILFYYRNLLIEIKCLGYHHTKTHPICHFPLFKLMGYHKTVCNPTITKKKKQVSFVKYVKTTGYLV